MSTANKLIDEVKENLSQEKEDLKGIVNDALDIADNTLYSPEAAAIGAALLAAAAVGYAMRHPEQTMFLVAEAGDVAQELMSELGGITSLAEIGGD